ncbi:hypothetical protein ACFQPG_00980 [Sphingomonas sp. GCM10030256]|uniref:hypothetical protein n=1 Tax=Sphingomonas sp. GCM10030256 TaxID=3273427 RepID=UPI0036134D80
MRTLILASAAVLAAAVPSAASAESWSNSGVTVHRGGAGHDRGTVFGRDRRGFDCDLRRDRRHDGRGGHRDRRPVECNVFAGGWYGGEWALYNNRTWEPDSYNDWWHDRPDRAFPRWVGSNANCDRRWWSGGGWRC